MTFGENYVTLSRIKLIKSDKRSFYILYLKMFIEI